MITYKSPLNWPNAIPVTPLTNQRSDSGFSAALTLTDALNFLDDEVKAAGIKQAVLYLDVEQAGVERLRKKVGSRTGVCLHIKYRDRGYILTCDKWNKLEHNIYALHLVIRQWCNMEKWGVGNLSMLMAGFEADRAPEIVGVSENIAECLKIFGLGSTATLDDATAIYHRRAKAIATDSDELVKLNQMMDEIRNYFSDKA